MKYVLMLCFIGVVMLISQGVCKQYRERYNLFEALNEFFRQMKLNLNFQKQKIKEIIANTPLKKMNKDIYSNYLNYLETGSDLDLSFIRILDEPEQEVITNMLISLGKNDVSGEIKQLEAYQEFLRQKIETARVERDKYCPLITKLSFLFALGFVIMFI